VTFPPSTLCSNARGFSPVIVNSSPSCDWEYPPKLILRARLTSHSFTLCLLLSTFLRTHRKKRGARVSLSLYPSRRRRDTMKNLCEDFSPTFCKGDDDDDAFADDDDFVALLWRNNAKIVVVEIVVVVKALVFFFFFIIVPLFFF